MRKEKQIVKKFYDTFGWYRNTDGIYMDTSSSFNAQWIIAKIPGDRPFLRKIVKLVPQITDDEKHKGDVSPPLYLHAHNYRWFQKTFPNDWNIDIRCWRSVGKFFTETFIPSNLLGQLLMRLIFWFETVFPHALAKIGTYPMIIIRKK